LQTGDWTTPPEIFRAAIGFIVKLYTAQGERFVRIQNSSLSTLSDVPALTDAQPLQVQQVAHSPVASMPPMSPMLPMQPMAMGSMQIDRETMSMQMGDMRLSMNPIERSNPNRSQTYALETAEATGGQRKFCSQCGVAIKPSDRFCASCGHRLD
jgi:membrane protease subunit (stomatin/prohibitin family)